MSSIRERTRETLERGKESRGEFAPRPDSAPVRLYSYWLNNTTSKKGKALRRGDRKENFCHYWRVVVFWSLVMGVRKFVERIFPLIVVSLVAVAVGGAGYAIYLIANANVPWMEVLVNLGILFVGIASAVALVIGILAGVKSLSKKMPKTTLRVTRFFDGPGPFIAVPSIIISVAMVATTVSEGPIALLWWFGIFATLGAAGFILVTAATYFDGKEAQRKEAFNALPLEERIAIKEAQDNVPPGRITKFFTGVRDVVVFMVQVVRVNKWKICPIVDIHQDVA